LAAGLAMDFFSLKTAFPCGASIMLAGTLVILAAAFRNIRI
jgi:hypothetical protein